MMHELLSKIIDDLSKLKTIVGDLDTTEQASGSGAVDSVNGQTGDVTLDADDIDDTSTTNKFATAAEKAFITTAVQPGDLATVATTGDYDDLSNTPTIPATFDDLADGTTNKAYTATEKTKLAGIEAAADVTDAANVGSSIHGASAKTTPVDADTMPLVDSAASNALKKVTWANIKATLKTYFDTLYNLYVHPAHTGDVTSVGDGATTIANSAITTAKIADDQVTFAKMQNIATDSLLGRATADTGDIELITLTAFARSLIDDANAATARTTLGAAGLTGDESIAGEKTFSGQTKFDAAFLLSAGGTQDYKFMDDTADALVTQAQGAGKSFDWRMETTDADGTDNIILTLWAVGKTGATVNRERLIFGYLAANQQFEFQSEANGAGTLRPIVIYTEGNTNQLRIETNGRLGSGVASAQGKAHFYDGTGGFIFVTKTGINGTAQTIIPDGTGDIVRGLTGFIVVYDGTSTVANAITIQSGNNLDIAIGTMTLRLALNVNGALTVVRQSGTGTATMALQIIWL